MTQGSGESGDDALLAFFCVYPGRSCARRWRWCERASHPTLRGWSITPPDASLLVECRAPARVRLERARRRSGVAGTVSDADAEVVRLQSEDAGLLDELQPDGHVTVRIDRPPDDLLDELAALIDARLARANP